MSSSSETLLEEQIMESGNKLLRHPITAEELLPILNKLEKSLSKVDQSPSKSMQSAISSPSKALISNEFLTHENVDVRVAVASCISEITRITAPEAPYDDDKMKEAFNLIVWSFEGLCDRSSPSYDRRTTILESVAKVRSCVIMLDLECEALIIEMFQHFLMSIRDYHPETVFVSMETIMTLVIEESEEISVDLLEPILASVKKDSQDYSPSSRALSEKVLRNCAFKLKPDLIQAVKSLGIFLDDYSEVLSFICLEKSDVVKQSESKLSVGDQSDEAKTMGTLDAEKVSENAVDKSHPRADVEKPLKLATSNGTAQTESKDSILTPNKSKPIEDGSGTRNANKSNKKEARTSRKRNQKPMSDPKKPISATEEPAVPDTDTDTDPKNEETHAKPVSPKVTECEHADNPSVSPSGRDREEPRSKKLGRPRKKRLLFDEEKSEGAMSAVKTHEPSPKAGPVDDSVIGHQDYKKRGRRKSNIWKDDKQSEAEVEGKPLCEIETALSPKSVPKTSEGTPIAGSTRKRATGKDKVDYGAELVGKKVKVWWPKDKMFYEGVVDSFDPERRKHKVSYTDGDMEILNLRKEKWILLEDKPGADEEGADMNIDSPQPKLKRKRVGEGSSKSRSAHPKSVKKPKDDSEKGVDGGAIKFENPVEEIPKMPLDADNDVGRSEKEVGAEGGKEKSRGSAGRYSKRKSVTPKVVDKVEAEPESADSLKNAESGKPESVDSKGNEASVKSKGSGGSSSRSGQKKK